MPRRPPTSTLNEADLLSQARAALRERGAIRLSALGPPALRPALRRELDREGFEVTKSFVRRPLAQQLLERLSRGERLPLKAKAASLKLAGATVTEVRRAAVALARAGKAHLVVEARAEVLVPHDEDVLTPEELRTTRDAWSVLGKRLQAVARPGSVATLSRGELTSLLATLPLAVIASPQQTRSPVAPSSEGTATSAAEASPSDRAPSHDSKGPERRDHRPSSTNERPLPSPAVPTPPFDRGLTEAVQRALMRAIDCTRDDSMGLSFVPRIVRALGPDWDIASAHSLLLEACRRGIVELRPESGLGRLSEEELRACPPGPQGTRLSWARRL